MSDSTDDRRIEVGSSSCPGAHRDVESSEAQLSSTREQITWPLVGKVNRDGTGIDVSCEDCVTRIGRKARDSNRSPANSNGYCCQCARFAPGHLPFVCVGFLAGRPQYGRF